MTTKTISPKLRFLLICLCLTYSLAIAFVSLGSHFISKQVFSSAVELVEMDAINKGILFNSTLSNIKNTFHLIASRTRLRELLDEKENGIIGKQWFRHRVRYILQEAKMAISTKRDKGEYNFFSIAEIAILNTLGELILSTSEEARKVSSSEYEIENSLLLKESGKYYMSYRGEFFTEQGRKYFLFLRLDVTNFADKIFIEYTSHKGSNLALAVMNKSGHITSLEPSKLDMPLFQEYFKKQQLPEVMSPVSFIEGKGYRHSLNTVLRLNHHNWFVLVQKPIGRIKYAIYRIQFKFLQLSMLIVLGSLIPFVIFAFRLSKERRSI